ncbi:hypothetical protein J4461_03425 [Candidatus Pacearchaeota archaeon]|nr:hypothetical protein [Candidatus Pacearchaeota archaeon]
MEQELKTEIIDKDDLEEARKLIRNSKSGNILIRSKTTEFNRKILEYGMFRAILIDLSNKKKNLRRSSGININHVGIKIAAKRKISFCIDLSELRNMNNQQIPVALAKIRTLIMLTQKYGALISLINLRDRRNALSLLRILGASSSHASRTLDF